MQVSKHSSYVFEFSHWSLHSLVQAGTPKPTKPSQEEEPMEATTQAGDTELSAERWVIGFKQLEIVSVKCKWSIYYTSVQEVLPETFNPPTPTPNLSLSKWLQCHKMLNRLWNVIKPVPVSSTRLKEFKSSLFAVFQSAHAQSVKMKTLMDDINKERQNRFSEPEVRSALAHMQDNNQVMVADDIIFLIWGRDKMTVFWNVLHGLWNSFCQYAALCCILSQTLTYKRRFHTCSTDNYSKQFILVMDLDPQCCRLFHQLEYLKQDHCKSLNPLCTCFCSVEVLYNVFITM